MKFVITSVDYEPADLASQIPIKGEVVRRLKLVTQPELFLAKIENPISWKTDTGIRTFSHLILSARWTGGAITPHMKDTPVNIAYVLDSSIFDDSIFSPINSVFVAIGAASGIPD